MIKFIEPLPYSLYSYAGIVEESYHCNTLSVEERNQCLKHIHTNPTYYSDTSLELTNHIFSGVLHRLCTGSEVSYKKIKYIFLPEHIDETGLILNNRCELGGNSQINYTQLLEEDLIVVMPDRLLSQYGTNVIVVVIDLDGKGNYRNLVHRTK